jgi:hypothetical protein
MGNMARIEVFPFRRFDSASGKMLEERRLSTREYIRERGGVIIEGGMRPVEDTLVDHQGRLVLDPSRDSARLLKQLNAAENGHGETTGNVNRNPLIELVDAGLATPTAVGPSHIDYDITELGRLFARDLLS